jgi:hypothetical protein
VIADATALLRARREDHQKTMRRGRCVSVLSRLSRVNLRKVLRKIADNMMVAKGQLLRMFAARADLSNGRKVLSRRLVAMEQYRIL